MVYRCLALTNRQRPGDNYRWTDNNIFKPKLSLKYDFSNFLWLGDKFEEFVREKYDRKSPTLLEIIRGIQKEEKLHQLKLHEEQKCCNKDCIYRKYLNVLIRNMQKIWKKLFKKVIVRDYDTPLAYDELEDPNHKIVYTLIYIYSMETFVVYGLNTATREKNGEKITTFGPLACA